MSNVEISPDRINSSNILDILKKSRLIRGGAYIESTPYQAGNYCIKEFRNTPLEQLMLYREVTNYAAIIAPNFSNTSDGHKYSLCVEPILNIIHSEKSQYTYTISRFVPGQHLYKFEPHIQELINNFSHALGQSLSVAGIIILPLNTKPYLSRKETVNHITDLCGSIAVLRKI